jgi:U3 small nucleolar RNA-associated protein MPP10
VELNQKPVGKKAQQNKETLGELKKGGVKVIDKKGNILDVEGNKVKAGTTLKGAGAFKL